MRILLLTLLLSQCAIFYARDCNAQGTIPTNGLRGFREPVAQDVPPIPQTPTYDQPVGQPTPTIGEPAPTQAPARRLPRATSSLPDSIFDTPRPAVFVPFIRPGDLQPSSTIQQTTYEEPLELELQAEADEPEDATEPAVAEGESEVSDPAARNLSRMATLEKMIASEIETLNANTQIDEETKSAKLTALTSAAELLQNTKTYRLRRDKYQSDIDNFPTALQSAKNLLKELESAGPLPTASLESPSDELQRELQRVLSDLETAKSDLEDLRASQSRYIQRVTEAPKRKSAAEKRLKKAQEHLADSSPMTADSHDESLFLQLAIRSSSSAELEMLNLESRQLELSAQLSPLKIDVASLHVKQLETQAEDLKRTAELARQREVERQIQMARNAALAANPQLAELATRNEELAQQRNALAQQIVDLSAETTKVNEQTKRLETDLASLQKKIDEGVSSTNSLLLAESHRQLASPLESRVRLSQLYGETVTVNQAVSQLQDERESLVDPHTVIVNQLGIQLENMDRHTQMTALEFVESKRSLLDDLLNDYRSYRRSLVETIAQRDKLITGIQLMRVLLNEHMLWVRSADPVGFSTLKKSTEALRDISMGARWSELTSRLWSRAQKSPYEYLLFTFGCAFLYGMVRKLKG